MGGEMHEILNLVADRVDARLHLGKHLLAGNVDRAADQAPDLARGIQHGFQRGPDPPVAALNRQKDLVGPGLRIRNGGGMVRIGDIAKPSRIQFAGGQAQDLILVQIYDSAGAGIEGRIDRRPRVIRFDGKDRMVDQVKQILVVFVHGTYAIVTRLCPTAQECTKKANIL